MSAVAGKADMTRTGQCARLSKPCSRASNQPLALEIVDACPAAAETAFREQACRPLSQRAPLAVASSAFGNDLGRFWRPMLRPPYQRQLSPPLKYHRLSGSHNSRLV